MKWIGQHIWDFISRFRSDVYLEGTETGTIASGGNLGLDSNNKIVKAASGSGDLTITNAADNKVVTSTGGTGLNAETNLTYDGVTLDMTGSNTIGNSSVAPLIFLDSEVTSGAGFHGIFVDIDGNTTSNNTTKGVTIDIDNSGVTGAANTHAIQALTIGVDDSATNHGSANLTHFGINSNMSFTNSSGDPTQYGFVNQITGGTTQYGIKQTLTGATVGTTFGLYQTLDDGSYDLHFESSASSADYFRMYTTTNGATMLKTVDGGSGGSDSDAHIEIEADGDITLDAEGSILLEAQQVSGAVGAVTYTANGANRPLLYLTNEADDATGPNVYLTNNRDGNGLSDNDVLGTINFTGEDAGGTYEIYGSIVGSVAEADDGDECGKVEIKVANDGTEVNGITLAASKAVASEVDVIIGNGLSSRTSIAGSITMGGAVLEGGGALTIANSALNMTLDSTGDIEINADSGIINIKDDTAMIAKFGSGGLSFQDNLNAGITFEGATDNTYQTTLGVVDPTDTRAVNLPNADGTVALTSDTSGGQFFMQSIGGYKTNNNSNSYYYFAYRGATGESWSNNDNSISSLNQYDAPSHFMIAPAAGIITNIKVHGYVSGTLDPFKFYIKHGAMTSDSDSIPLTDMFNTSTITPPTTLRTWNHTEDFSSNNSFDEDDMLYCFIKKDSTSGNSSHYFTMTISGYIYV